MGGGEGPHIPLCLWDGSVEDFKGVGENGQGVQGGGGGTTILID